jgi:hypothetical protein
VPALTQLPFVLLARRIAPLPFGEASIMTPYYLYPKVTPSGAGRHLLDQSP